MKTSHILNKQTITAVTFLLAASYGYPAEPIDSPQFEAFVTQTIKPVIKRYQIPGMAIAITQNDKIHFFNYGMASKAENIKVTENTLFEIGSVTKTFTATLAALSQVEGKLSLSDNAGKYWPALNGTHLEKVTLLQLGTYTAGGLPLQFPDNVKDDASLLNYLKNWQPDYAAGTHRLYSNPSLGLFGYLTTKSQNQSFQTLMEKNLFPRLHLPDTYIKVPQEEMKNYAWGYSKNNQAVRVNPGILDGEAYGVKTSAAALISYIQSNIDSSKLDKLLQQAIAITHTGYYNIGEMEQGLGWEMYRYPVSLETLLAGNSSEVMLKPNVVTPLRTSQFNDVSRFYNKTGSTNGFGAYVAFVPEKRLGIVILANKNYPNDMRITLAYQILSALENDLTK